MAQQILITGISGFVGSHLAEYCLRQGAAVHGTIRSHHLGDELTRIEGIRRRLTLHECDLRNRVAVARVLERTKPVIIFHLAAQSFVPTSWESPEDTLVNNIISELNILEVVRELRLDPAVHIAGSSEEYGLVQNDELPIKETNPLRPLSPYAVSKIGQDMLAFQYHRSYGIRTIITRCFNTEGPGRGKQFVLSSFAYQVAAAEAGRQEPILRVGNLAARRDFIDVRDVTRALWLAVRKCTPGEVYNIGSGTTHEIREALDILLGFSRVALKVEEDPRLLRPSDVPILQCDATKFVRATGWRPEIDFPTTLRDTLAYWRKELGTY